MQLRFLKRGRSKSNIWPPCGTGRYDLRDSTRLRENGVLTAVSRIGNRLSVTIHFEGRDHLTLLQEWNEPPTIDEVHRALRTMIGRRVREVGEVDIQEPRRPDLDGY